MPTFAIRDFKKSDQLSAKNLIEKGMIERWGWLDQNANPDLENIAQSFDYFCVAELKEKGAEGKIVGTGGIRNGEIVRVSVDAEYRRWGLGRVLTRHLIQKSNLSEIRVETNTTWHSARKLYESLGFKFSHEKDGETHYILRL